MPALVAASATARRRPLLAVERLRQALRRAERRWLAAARGRRCRRSTASPSRSSRGETLALVGESGCGKTTTGKSVLRLVEPTAGSVRSTARRSSALDAERMRERRRDMQIIFQDPYASLEPAPVRAGEIVGEPLRNFRRRHARARRSGRRERAAVAVRPASACARKRLASYPHEFSGGQRQRLGIARALALDPKLIVCDEPVSALDVSVQAQVINLLTDLQAEFGIAYLFVAHDLAVVRHISHRVAVMYLGHIVEIADRDDAVRGAAPSLHRDPALGGAGAGPAPSGRSAAARSGDPPSPADPPPRLPLPHPLPAGAGGLPGAAAAARRRGDSAGTHVASPATSADLRSRPLHAWTNHDNEPSLRPAHPRRHRHRRHAGAALRRRRRRARRPHRRHRRPRAAQRAARPSMRPARSSRPASSTRTPTTTRRCCPARHGLQGLAGRDDRRRRQLRHQHRRRSRPTRRCPRRSTCSTPARQRALHDLRGLLRRSSSATPAALNVAALVGHSTLRVRTMASLDRVADADEIAAMQALLAEALDAGAIGLSTGTFYPPAVKASTEEIIEVGRPLGGARRLYVTHMRDECRQGHGGARRDVPHRPRARRAGRRLAPQGAEPAQLRPLGGDAAHIRDDDEAASAICLDCYPYTAGSTMIRTDRGMLEGRVLIASSQPHPECAGRDLGAIAEEWGVAESEAARRLQPGSAIYFLMDEKRRAAHPRLRRNDDRLRRHPRRREAASAPVGHVSARARPLQPRRRTCSRSRPRSGR